MTKRQMRILYVSPCWPHGESFGSQLRALQVCRALQQIGDLSLVVVDYSRPDTATVERTAAEFHILGSGTYHSYSPWPVRLQRIISARAPSPEGFIVDKALADIVLPRLAEFDLIWLHNLRAANPFQIWRWSHSVMDIDDVPSTYFLSIAKSSAPLPQRLRAACRVVLWRRRERLLKERFDALAVCSEADRTYLGAQVPVHVIPNGFPPPACEPERKRATPVRIGFIGRYAYLPNLEGLRWFVTHCWPAIKQQVPLARLRIVGRDSDGPLKPQGPDIDGLGWVENAAPEIATWSLMIVPIWTGAGTRVKLAEAFSRKTPVVSTRLGAFGYDVKDGVELLMADTAETFAAGCVRLMQNPEEGDALSGRAWQRYVKEWTWDALAPRTWAAANACARHNY